MNKLFDKRFWLGFYFFVALVHMLSGEVNWLSLSSVFLGGVVATLFRKGSKVPLFYCCLLLLGASIYSVVIESRQLFAGLLMLVELIILCQIADINGSVGIASSRQDKD